MVQAQRLYIYGSVQMNTTDEPVGENMNNTSKMLWTLEVEVSWDETAFRSEYKMPIPAIVLYWKGHDNKAWWISPIKL